MKMVLSVCLIAKNEEEYIGKALNSIKDLADEIIVVDTGSKDKTKEIARNYTEKVFDFNWDNDFSKARNFSIEKSVGDWILILDADEEIVKGDILKIKELLAREKENKAYYFKIENIIKEELLNVEVSIRLFKREYRYIGNLYERLSKSSIEYEEIQGVGKIDIAIKHYGYNKGSNYRKEKNMKNLSILLNYDDEKKDGYYYFILGNEYEIKRNFDKSIQCYEKSLALIKDNDEEVFKPKLIINLIKILNDSRKFHRAITVFEEYKNKFSGFRDIYFLGAISAMKILDYKKADRYLNIYIKIKDEKFIYPSYNFNLNYDISRLTKMIKAGSNY